MMSDPNIVERLYAEWRRRRSKIFREAALEIERLRVACDGALIASRRIVKSNMKLRQRLDEVEARERAFTLLLIEQTGKIQEEIAALATKFATNASEAIAKKDDSRA